MKAKEVFILTCGVMVILPCFGMICTTGYLSLILACYFLLMMWCATNTTKGRNFARKCGKIAKRITGYIEEYGNETSNNITTNNK